MKKNGRHDFFSSVKVYHIHSASLSRKKKDKSMGKKGEKNRKNKDKSIVHGNLG